MKFESNGDRWIVTTSEGKIEDVGADFMVIGSGSLIFLDEDDDIVMAYGPGGWREVQR